jgi:predicted NBD/HSP70 family sugar kinase
MPDDKSILNDLHIAKSLSTLHFVDAQLERFTASSIRAVQTRVFNPYNVAESLTNFPGSVTAVDIGGDKLAASTYTAWDGKLRQTGIPCSIKATAGAGYLDVLEEISQRSAVKSTALGISYAGPVKGSKILAGPNLATFVKELRGRYAADFGQLNPWTTVLNDGEAGLLASAIEAVHRFVGVRNVILIINGSGLNCSILKDGQVFTAEAGHVPAEEELNLFGQQKPCGMLGANYVCLENLAASRAGIEDLWWQLRGRRADGREIAAARAHGDKLATSLYDSSAWVTAHVVKGAAIALDLGKDWRATVIVGHGGTFAVPGYAERIRTILETDLATPIQFFLTADFSRNACMEGAAIAAFSKSVWNNRG